MSLSQTTITPYRLKITIYSLPQQWATQAETLTSAIMSAVNNVLSDITITWNSLVNDQGCHLTALVEGTASQRLPRHSRADAPSSLTSMVDQITAHLAAAVEATPRIQVHASRGELTWHMIPGFERNPPPIDTGWITWEDVHGADAPVVDTAPESEALAVNAAPESATPAEDAVLESATPAPSNEAASTPTEQIQPSAQAMPTRAVAFQSFFLGTGTTDGDIWAIGEPHTAPSDLNIIGFVEAPSAFAAVAAWIAIKQGADPSNIAMHPHPDLPHVWRFSVGQAT